MWRPLYSNPCLSVQYNVVDSQIVVFFDFPIVKLHYLFYFFYENIIGTETVLFFDFS